MTPLHMVKSVIRENAQIQKEKRVHSQKYKINKMKMVFLEVMLKKQFVVIDDCHHLFHYSH